MDAYYSTGWCFFVSLPNNKKQERLYVLSKFIVFLFIQLVVSKRHLIQSSLFFFFPLLSWWHSITAYCPCLHHSKSRVSYSSRTSLVKIRDNYLPQFGGHGAAWHDPSVSLHPQSLQAEIMEWQLCQHCLWRIFSKCTHFVIGYTMQILFNRPSPLPPFGHIPS